MDSFNTTFHIYNVVRVSKKKKPKQNIILTDAVCLAVALTTHGFAIFVEELPPIHQKYPTKIDVNTIIIPPPWRQVKAIMLDLFKTPLET